MKGLVPSLIVLIIFVVSMIFFLVKKRSERRSELKAINDARKREVAEQIINNEWIEFLRTTSENYVNEHLDTLIRKRAQTIITDDYGIEDKSKWFREINYFIENIIMPDIRAYIANNQDYDIDENKAFEIISNSLDNNLEVYLAQNDEDRAEIYDETMTPHEYDDEDEDRDTWEGGFGMP